MNVLIVALDVVPTEVRDAEVLGVAPVLNSWLRHWLSDEDTARRRAGGTGYRPPRAARTKRCSRRRPRRRRRSAACDRRRTADVPGRRDRDRRGPQLDPAGRRARGARERTLRPPHVPHGGAAPTCGLEWARVSPLDYAAARPVMPSREGRAREHILGPQTRHRAC
jgi:hypothetical protein